MRALHVVPTYAPAWRYGGPIHAVHGLCRALASDGHTVSVFTTSVDGPNDLDVPRGLPVDRDGVSVRYFPSPMLRRLYWSPELGAALRESTAHFDVVHTHLVFLWPTWRAARAALSHRLPLVVSPRGMLVPELIATRSAWAKRLWIRLIERRNLTIASVIHVTSRAEARDLARAGLDLAPVRVVPNGVDRVQAPDDARPRDARIVLFLGRISWKKRIDRLVDALALVPEAQLVIAGNDDEGLVPALERRARERGVADRVRFVGHLAGDVKRAMLERCAVMVLPSMSENFGNVVVEAMAHGCPVIVTPEVGAAELVSACDGGLIADGAPEALAAAMRTLLADPAAARAMGERGRDYVERELDWTTIARRMAAVYAEAADFARRGGSHAA